MSREPDSTDPLGPLATVVRILLGVTATFAVIGAIALPLSGGSFLDIGEDPLCRTPNFVIGTDTDTSALTKLTFGLAPGVTVQHNTTEICQTDPSAVQTALASLSIAPSFVLFFGFLLLVRQIITYARRNGLFSNGLALRIERLGWLLLLGLLATASVEWLADGLLKHSMASTMSWTRGDFSISIVGIIAAYGIVSVGRVMSRAAKLQEDADATI